MNDRASGAFAGVLAGFGPVQKVFLFLGFTIFCFGIPKGFDLGNRIMMTGVSLMAAGIAGHYWSTCRYATMSDEEGTYGGEFKVRTVTLGLVFSGLCVASAILAYRGM